MICLENREMRFFTRRCLLLPLLLFLALAQVAYAQPTVVLRGHKATKRGELRLSLLRSGLERGCSTTVYGGEDLGSLLNHSKRKAVFTLSSKTEVLGIYGSSLPKASKRRVLFQAELTCPNQDTVVSEVVSYSFKGSTGAKPLSGSALLDVFKRKLKRKSISLSLFGSNLKFPRALEFVDGGNGRFYVVRQSGIVQTFEASSSASTSTEFIDLSSRVLASGERGLIGMAFHPNFSQNHEFFLFYNAAVTGTSTLSRFHASEDGLTGDPSTEEVLLTIEQTTSIHKGGTLRFGPDGYLYVAVGDGGPQGDPNGHGQSRKVLYGKILRIDVNASSDGKSYSIPSGNPFRGNTKGFREEIFAYGFRNPFKFSFDKLKGTIWAGDVGLQTREEIDIVKKGKNYGWNTMEGTTCFKPAKNCSTSRLELPVFDYPRTEGASVIGGFVYRGSNLFPLEGLYVFGDFASGTVWALLRERDSVTRYEILRSGFLPSSFGEDRNGEQYLLDYLGGELFSLAIN